MKEFWKGALVAAAALGTMLAGAGTASAGVSVHVGVGAPGYYYGPGYYPPGPCDAYNTYYEGDCGYALYNGPVFMNGAYINGPHYYRWWGGRPVFWYRGGWHNWEGWRGVHWNWNRGEGWGWRGGRWDRNWGRGGIHLGVGGGKWHGDNRWNGGGKWHGDHRWSGGGKWHGDNRWNGGNARGGNHWNGGGKWHGGTPRTQGGGQAGRGGKDRHR